MTARPFLKCAGGKTHLLPNIKRVLPAKFSGYHEPFMGGAALFWDLRPNVAHLNDLNTDFVDAYLGVRDDCDKLIGALQTFELEYCRSERGARRLYDRLREDDEDSRLYWRAARTIFLNKTGFNGLYRVNRKGRFNVPFGTYSVTKTICDVENLRACSKALQGVQITNSGFEDLASIPGKDDLVYFDPPYYVSATSSFASYTPMKFGRKDHERLRDVAEDLVRRGVYVLLSNSYCEEVGELYKDWVGHVVSRPNSISSGKRARTQEVILVHESAAWETISGEPLRL